MEKKNFENFHQTTTPNDFIFQTIGFAFFSFDSMKFNSIRKPIKISHNCHLREKSVWKKIQEYSQMKKRSFIKTDHKQAILLCLSVFWSICLFLLQLVIFMDRDQSIFAQFFFLVAIFSKKNSCYQNIIEITYWI